MTISLVKVAKYYQGHSHQDAALAYLEQELGRTNPELIGPESDFATLWRNPPQPPETQTLSPGLPNQVNLQIPYLSQLDNVNNPHGSCNVTCVAMCLAYLGHPHLNQWGDQLEDELYQYCLDNGLSRHSPVDLAKVVRAYGYQDDFQPDAKWGEVKDWLAAGNPIIVHGWFTASGHIIVIRGYNDRGWIVNDPYGEWYEWGYDTQRTGEGLTYSYGMMSRVCGTDGDLWIHYVSK
ncbi:C39 family peptidase [Phormidium yuhuli AB48]|uniref:C39 family peptidase n=1 Tax=Phormidium yuhuli AB48 TaxID=2940671 RepID=A0ABY5AMT1_9CYAN|nr:C39 family peptidase [Phormidium yuhuli]USR89666.1 C39 family peptidase [Phormidium yuhuli AB48]